MVSELEVIAIQNIQNNIRYLKGKKNNSSDL